MNLQLDNNQNIETSWGNRRDFQNWSAPVATTNFLFDRGFTGHQMLDEFGIIDMNGRIYDPVIARFFSPDPYIQAPTNTQNFNRYSYVMNNPLVYTDPSGELVWVPIVIGSIIGTYMGGTLANNNYNPANWDYSSGKTWGYMVAGGIAGGISGYVGGIIATSGMPMANTAAIAGSSYTNSVFTNIYTGGQTYVSIAFGVGSYNFDTNKWDGIWNWKENSTLENIGYSFGALANISDMVSFINGVGENIEINSASTKDGHEWWGHSSATKNGERLVSFGPDSGVEKSASLSETWKNSIKGAKNWETYYEKKGTWTVRLNNVSTKAMNDYASGVTRWDLLFNSCVGHTTRALWRAGVPTLYLFHPHMLNLQLFIRQIGIYSSPYLYQIQ